MTQYVYGKNVVNQLLQNKKTIYEVILSDGWKDKNIVNTLKKRDIPIKILGKKKML